MQLSVKDVSKLLNVDDKTIYGWIKQGDIPVYRINEAYRFNRADILEWATARQIAHAVPEPDAPDQLAGLADALRTGGIAYGVEGSDKASVLRNVVDAMQLPAEVNREFLYEVLLAREALASTGIGNGVAIPHPRSPIVLYVPQPMIALCFLEHAVEYGALDGIPVQAIFAIISPTIATHLSLLSKLAFALRRPAFSEAIDRQGTREEIVDAAMQIDDAVARRTADSSTEEGEKR